ncbi:hypothetical protein [Ruegeria sp. HKCCD8929]|uniref:hypothetical protein n=1 Tax=Ruegeria sp. HKCCD8929 TaxID=2683006 RepID=UPI00148A1225|nr:hypothetical protein [Ruegeria sp. HKCCD8929]
MKPLIVAATSFVLVAGVTFLLFAVTTYPMGDQFRVNSDRLRAAQQALHEVRLRLSEIESSAESLPNIDRVATLAENQQQAEIDLQEDVLHMANEVDLRPNAFGQDSSPQGMGARSAGFFVETEGAFENVVAFLSELERANPPIAVEKIWVRRLSPRLIEGVETPVFARISVWRYWVEGEQGT